MHDGICPPSTDDDSSGRSASHPTVYGYEALQYGADDLGKLESKPQNIHIYYSSVGDCSLSCSHTRARARRTVVALVASATLALALPPLAGAHSFLIRSTPQAGARLASSPSGLVLYFSEPYVRSSERVSIRHADGGDLKLSPATGSGTVVRQPLPARLKGAFVVSWRVLSDDGHLSVGEFAFAVGAGGALPVPKASSARTPWSQVVASWLFFVGLALALGGLASERFVWRTSARRAPIFVGLVLAALGALGELVLIAGGRVGGGFRAGLSWGALTEGIQTRPESLTLVVLVAIAAAAALVADPRTRVLALAPLLAAAAVTALRGHSGTSGHWWAVVADAIHLIGAALWVGALLYLVLVVARSGDRGAALGEGIHRYSRLALPTVVLILVSGVLTALAEFGSVGELLDTSYGRTLVVKSGLVVVALLFAASARRWALSQNPRIRLPLLRRLTAGETVTLLGVLAAVALLVNLAPPRSSAARQLPDLGPPPLSGPAVRLADLAGQLVVGLAATERELQFTVVQPSDQFGSSVKLSAEAERPGRPDADLYPRPCGDGCFSIRFRLPTGTTVVQATVSAEEWDGGKVRFEIPSPVPPEQPALLRRVSRAMRAVPNLELTETVRSGPSSAAQPARYTLTGKAFMATELYGSGAVDVRPISNADGLTVLTFALPGSNIWYRIWIDRSNRLRREVIVSPGHLIKRAFAYSRRRQRAPGGLAPSPSSAPAIIPTGPFVLAREDDHLAVGLAARPAGRRLALTATVLGGDGRGVSGLHLAFRIHTAATTFEAQAVPCGSGCYRATPTIEGTPRLLLLRVERLGQSPTLLRYPFPAQWPPPSATALARHATRVFYGLRSLVIDERLASSASAVVRTEWKIVAPNRLAYTIAGGSQAVVIGGRRWDRDPGGRWQSSTVSPLSQPSPVWGTAPAQASLLGSARVAGRPVWVVSFVQPAVPAWFTISIDKATFRTLELRMVAPAHFMHHRYSAFNQPLAIRSPR